MKINKAIVSAIIPILSMNTVANAQSLEYNFKGVDNYGFATPSSTSVTTFVEDVNIDKGKNNAILPPDFGTNYYTYDNNYSYSSPTIPDTSDNQVYIPDYSYSYGTNFEPVTSQSYFSDGSIGTLSISKIGLSIKVYEGTDDEILSIGAGHFSSTSFGDGNIAIAAHNRGVVYNFGDIHLLSDGDVVYLTTTDGVRIYQVYSNTTIYETSVEVLNATSENILTLITCVKDNPQYRTCVKAIQIG